MAAERVVHGDGDGDGEVLDLGRLESVLVDMIEDGRGWKSISAKQPNGDVITYELGRPIESGANATVYEATCTTWCGTWKVAVKLIDPAKLNTAQAKDALRREADALRALTCVKAKHVVQIR